MGKIHVIDSHTGGEPTRVVVAGGPPLGSGTLLERRDLFRSQYDHYRSAIIHEPRGYDAVVGALLCEPLDPSCAAGVIFFNNVGYLGMCGHGTIGLAATLEYLGRIGKGTHRIETPVGIVAADLHGGGEVTVANVACYRSAANLTIHVAGYGPVTGDVAWGGNWFFLTDQCPVPLRPSNLELLTGYACRIREALQYAGIAGDNGGEIDHIEISGEALSPDADSRNFVLCPGKSYDRSPCGTGTSAKLACLFADGKFQEGQTWRQESIIGSVFEGSIRVQDGVVFPHIRGSAFVNSEAVFVLDERDPLCWGIRDETLPRAESLVKTA